jgi:flagellin-like protein
MNPHQQSDERAVAPVVGVALLIGITVILAAVIGNVVLSVGIGPAETPDVTVSFDVVDGEVMVVHEGGEQLRKSEVVIRDTNGTEYELESDLVTGERATIVDTNGNPLDLDTTSVDRLTVVWQGSGDSESVLATFEP